MVGYDTSVTRYTDGDVTRAVSPADALAAVRAVCQELRAGALEVPVRTALAEGAYLVMPARHRPSGTATTKVVTVSDDGHASVSGVVLWTGGDGATVPLAPAAAFTALRTAAVSAAAADALSPQDASRLAVLGTGSQARAHVQALAGVRPLTRVRLLGRDPRRAAAAQESLQADLPQLRVELAADVRHALADADLVCCTTTAAAPLFTLADLGTDVHVTAVGSHRRGVREVPRELLATASLVVVDDVPAALAEAGEVIDAVEHGVIRGSDLVELSTLLGSAAPSPGGRTLFKSVGTAAFDWGLARLLAQRAATVLAG